MHPLVRELSAFLDGDRASLRPVRDEEPRAPDAAESARKLAAEAMLLTPPPCESDCPHWTRCRDERLSCAQFFAYCRGEQWADAPREPTRDWYGAIFQGGKEIPHPWARRAAPDGGG